MTSTAGRADLAAVQRRAVPVLAGAQVAGGIGVASGIAIGGLLAERVSGSTAMSGFAQTAAVLGAALLAVPMAGLAQRHGRRPALVTGLGVAAAGAATTITAAQLGSFPLLLVGTLLFGGGTAAGLQSRFAATDAAAPGRRGRALSTVVWATTVGAVLGPNLSGAGGRLGDAVGIEPLAGPYLFSLVAFGIAAAVLLVGLRPDPLVAARKPGDGALPHVSMAVASRAVAASGAATLALVAVAAAHAVMVGVMVMTPVHLSHRGASLQVIGIVISAHIAGMYAASPLWGALADRAGPRTGVLAGLAVLATSLAVTGTAPDGVGIAFGLVLLGLGWSGCLVCGSALLTASVPDGVRPGVQGLSDLSMGLVGAAAGAASGPVLGAWGYGRLSAAAAVLMVPAVVLAVRHFRFPAVGAPV